MNEEQFPATCVAHWPSGPVPCCDAHAQGLVKLGRFLGAHVAVTRITEPEECTNCVNEPKKDPQPLPTPPQEPV